MSITDVGAGIIPMLIYPLFLYWMDRYDKEPIGLLTAVFLWGFVPAAALSMIAEFVVEMPFWLTDRSGQLADLATTLVIAPLTEEFFKGTAILGVFLIWKNKFDGVFDGIIYGSLVGFGFAATENILYFSQYGLDLFFTRAVLFGLNHALFTSLTGIGFGVARNARNPYLRLAAPILGLMTAIFAHAVHNASVTLQAAFPPALCLGILSDWGGALFVFVIMLVAIRRERQWIIDQLRDEVSLNTLNQTQYIIASSPTRRFSTRLHALVTGGLSLWAQSGRYFDILTQLAYKKHAHSRRGEAGAPQALIESLRIRANTMSMQLSGLFA